MWAPIFTVCSAAVSVLEWRNNKETLRKWDTEEIKAQYSDLVSLHAFDSKSAILLMEGHLNIIDSKSQSVLAFSANYIIIMATVLYVVLDVHHKGALAIVTSLIPVLMVACFMVYSFVFVNKVVWQDYNRGPEQIFFELMTARRLRTRNFIITKILYIFSFGIFADSFILIIHGQLPNWALF
jgi:hypothetical protein